MTIYEHIMVGANLALGAGLHRRFGWRIVGMAGIVAALPDWDGLSILFGAQAYSRIHRVWGHNLLVATITGGGLAGVEYCSRLSEKIRQLFNRSSSPITSSDPSASPSTTPALNGFLVWMLTGIGVSWSHLLADLFYSGHADLTGWPLQLAWPFSNRGWVYPIVPGGDLGATLLFVGEMFALYRWPARAQNIALVTVLAVIAYVVLRSLMRAR